MTGILNLMSHGQIGIALFHDGNIELDDLIGDHTNDVAEDAGIDQGDDGAKQSKAHGFRHRKPEHNRDNAHSQSQHADGWNSGSNTVGANPSNRIGTHYHGKDGSHSSDKGENLGVQGAVQN